MAGPDSVRRLKVADSKDTGSYLACIPHLYNLELLEIQMHCSAYCELSVSPFACLQRLQNLKVVGTANAGVSVAGLQQLPRLTALSLIDAYPSCIPLQVTNMCLTSVVPAPHRFLQPTAALVMGFQGRLAEASLDLSLFDNRAACLAQAACLQGLLRLQLDICNWTHCGSGWCTWFFSQLEVLQVSFRWTSSAPSSQAHIMYRPEWDLSCCLSLKELHFIMDSLAVDLRGIKHVTATTFRLDLPDVYTDPRLALACQSWSLKEAVVTRPGMPEGNIAWCVTDAVRALMRTRDGPPVLTVNGMSPVQHAMHALWGKRSDWW